MKKYIIGGSILAVLITVLIISLLPKKEAIEVLFLSQSNYILYEKDCQLSFIYFTNDPNYELIDEYSAGFIENEDQSLKFIVDQISQVKIHNEMFRGQTYYGYKIYVNLPDITGSYYMEKLYLKLDTHGQSYHFFAGELFVEYQTGYDKLIPWTGLEGIKKTSPQLSQIIVDVSDYVQIDAVYIGPYLVTYFYGNNELIIHAPEDTYLFNETYVKIVTDMGITYLPQFNYFSNYQLLISGYYSKHLI